MAESEEEDELSLISTGLYRIVSDVIGPECIVKLRRQILEVMDTIYNCNRFLPVHRITSGSVSEGFLFKTSDLDVMFVDRNVSVCTESNFSYVKTLQSSCLFVTENEECSPGFTLLRCLTCDRKTKKVYNSLVRKGDNMYLSSKNIRETFLQSTLMTEHGPCQSTNFIGFEFDFALTLRCPVWPEQAHGFLIRSLNRGWPSYDVLKDICSDGCLFVPINSKQQMSSDLINLEWRMSFSLAEKKLIYSMNHCQFLCYGLTKLFLIEVIKECHTVHDLLCSYFMKTAVFWEISENPLEWSMQAFLFKFWNVFRRLIRWIRDGYCPNFFITENNMFYGKICGENQRMLLSVLIELYSDGYLCLLRCTSLHDNLTKIITQPYLVHMFACNEEEYVSVSRTEMMKLLVVLQFGGYIPMYDLNKIIMILHNTINTTTDSEEMSCTVRMRINYILQKYAESVSVYSPSVINTRNIKQYHATKSVEGLLLTTKTYFCMNYLYYAIYTFVTGNYLKTIDISNYIKHRLQSQPYTYKWSLDDDIIMTSIQQGMPYDTLIRSFIVDDVVMDSDTCIEELLLECRAEKEHRGAAILTIPPLVIINFLLILSYTRLGEYHRRCDILEELCTLLHHDDDYHIYSAYKAISWEILGICQQIFGDRQAAFQSYINALNEEYNYFKEATIARINSLYD